MDESIEKEEEFVSTKDRIVDYLKQHGQTTVDDLSSYLEITKMAVRKHLNSLAIQGVVITRKVTGSVGRPHEVYLLGASESPSEALAMDLLDSVKENYGKKALLDLMSVRSKKFFERYKNRLLNKSPRERVYEVAKVLNENGYVTHVEEDPVSKRIVIRHENCPLSNVAPKHMELCIYEVETIEEFLGAKIKRLSHFCENNQYCSYEVLI